MDPRGIQSPPLLHVWALLLFLSTFSCQHFDRFSGALLRHCQCFSTRFGVAIFTLAHQFTSLTKSRQWMVYQWRVQGTIEIVVMSCWKCFYIYFLNFIFIYIKIRKKNIKKMIWNKKLMFLKILFHCKNKKKQAVNNKLSLGVSGNSQWLRKPAGLLKNFSNIKTASSSTPSFTS